MIETLLIVLLVVVIRRRRPAPPVALRQAVAFGKRAPSTFVSGALSSFRAG